MVVVEARQRTLGVAGRGWGPAANTRRGWSWLRSGSEHWTWLVMVEVRQRTLGVAGRGWGPAANTGRGWSWLRSGGGGRGGGEGGAATDIKSNNPHLAGGEWSRSQMSYNQNISAKSLKKQQKWGCYSTQLSASRLPWDFGHLSPHLPGWLLATARLLQVNCWQIKAAKLLLTCGRLGA